MPTLPHLLERNRAWARRQTELDPRFFSRLSKAQHPDYLWIGCSDSRIPANQVVDLDPGEVFVHRNVANLVGHGDLNLLSVVQYAVEILQVGHVIVVGHYGCGGIRSALEDQPLGLIDNWLQPIRELAEKHRPELDGLDFRGRVDRLCELNVLAQARNLSRTRILREAWGSGRSVELHSWIYSLEDGRIKPLQDVLTAPTY